MKSQKFYTFLTVFVFSISFSLFANSADITQSQINDIEKRVNALSYNELKDRRDLLLNEQSSLLVQQDNTQNPSVNKATAGRLSTIAAELSAIQKALALFLGAAALNSITDEGYDRSVPPVITVNGANPATVELGSAYSDAGATAASFRGASVTVSSSSNVDTSSVGSYAVSYTATDANGNTTSASRAVNVVDTTAPVITVTGDNPATAELGGTYTDAGATATDLSGDIDVVSTGTVDTDTLGENTITYTATDASGNSATDSRVINVTDTTVPVFTSASTFVIEEGTTAVGTVTATDINSASDIKLKKNIKTIENPISKIMGIEGVSFNWKYNNKPSLGVTADHLQNILPELVKEDDIKSVNYNGLVGLLIECVKNQQQQIDELKDQLNS